MVGDDLCKIMSRKVHRPRTVRRICKVVGKVRKFLGKAILSFTRTLPKRGLSNLGIAPNTCLNSYHCGLPRSLRSPICPELFGGFRRVGVN